VIITSVELREIRLPLIHFFETSFGRTTERSILLVRVRDADGGEGWGECTAGEGPFYCDEWTETAWSTIGKFLAGMVVGREVPGAEQIWGLMRSVRGHRMAKAAIETACWDLEAKRLGLPLWKHLGGVRQRLRAEFLSVFRTLRRRCSKRSSVRSRPVTNVSKSRSSPVGICR
jgi:O-succinylbenzoate synthase